jgi:hypothetical protein
VLGALHTTPKLEPVILRVWLSVLARTRAHRTVLWLLLPVVHTEGFAARLRAQAAAVGVEPHRLVFLPHASDAEHRRRLAAARLVLDTRVYGAQSTAAEMLHAGTPVLTIKGDSAAGRVAASLLAAADASLASLRRAHHDDNTRNVVRSLSAHLVTHSLREFEDRAVQLVLQPAYLSAIRAAVAAVATAAEPRLPPFNAPVATAAIERAYRLAWDIRAIQLAGTARDTAQLADAAHASAQLARIQHALRECVDGTLAHHIAGDSVDARRRYERATCFERLTAEARFLELGGWRPYHALVAPDPGP